MRSTRLSLVHFAAALAVAVPAFLAAPAVAQGNGSAGGFRYEAYLAKQAKIEAMHKMTAKSEQKAAVGTSEVSTDGKSSAGNGGRHYLHAVPLAQEQHYRGM